MDPTHFVQINTGSPEPIYRQLIEQVKRRVAAGQLQAGDEIPSVRELAQVRRIGLFATTHLLGPGSIATAIASSSASCSSPQNAATVGPARRRSRNRKAR